MTAIELRDKLNIMFARGTIRETAIIAVVYEEMVFDEIEVDERNSGLSFVPLSVL